MKVPDRIQKNAYRILRLRGEATLADIHSAAGALKRSATLGISTANDEDILSLGAVPRTDSDIRAATGRLENPSQRIAERLFWYRSSHLHDSGHTNTRTDLPGEIISKHDSALSGLISAYQKGLVEGWLPGITTALRNWFDVVDDDKYWIAELETEEHGRFEPRPLVSEYEALRSQAVLIAAEPLIGEAIELMTSGDYSSSRAIIQAISSLSDTGKWAVDAIERIIGPLIQKIAQLSEAIREDCGKKIVREHGSAEQNHRICDAALKRYRKEIEPSLKALANYSLQESTGISQAQENAALCLSGIGADYTWANDFIISEKLHIEALELAKNTLAVVRIEHGLSEIKDSAAHQRFYGKPVKSAPSLRTVNGIGGALYGSSDYDLETKSFATTYYFTILFIPIFPVGRYRVISVDGRRYQFIGKLPFRKFDLWHIAITIALIISLILYNVYSSSGQATYSNTSPSDQTYYVSSSTETQLDKLKNQIDAGRSQIKLLELELGPSIKKMDALQSRITALRNELDSMDRQKAQGLYVDISDYNQKVDLHNALVRQYRQIHEQHATEIDKYETLFKKDKLLVSQYNALVSSGQ